MPEPKDKLDTSVNGPEDPRPVFPAFDGDAWERVDWRRCEEEVRRLRGRIFKAVQERDMATAVDLQKLMLRSWHNTLASVRQVTQRNTGRKTAGIDGLVALTSQARAEMAVRVHATRGSHQPSRSGGCISRKPVIRQKCDRSEFRLFWTDATRLGSVMRWNPSGRPGSSPDLMGSGRAAAATTQ